MEFVIDALKACESNIQRIGVPPGSPLVVLPYTDLRLREVSRPMIDDIFKDDFQLFLNNMVSTMVAHYAVGLAAIQVGVPLRVMVVRESDGNPVKIINPVLKDVDTELIEMSEGCLSYPGLFLKLKRPAEATIEFLNEKGELRVATGDKLLGRAILHEMDHLDGKLFVDLVPKVLRRGVIDKYEIKKRQMTSKLKKQKLARTGVA